MKLLRILLVLAGASATASAQTTASTQTNAAQAREMSLQDCLLNALERNLDLRIARIGPALAQLALQGSYAGYDPTFTIGGRHDFSMSGGRKAFRAAQAEQRKKRLAVRQEKQTKQVASRTRSSSGN